MTARLQWVEGSTPWYLIALLVVVLIGVVAQAIAEHRNVDPWVELARRDRRLGR